MKYKDWLKTWLELYVQPTVKIRTYEKYGQVIRARILPKLGEYELCDLTAEVLQTFVVELCSKLSANSVNGTITVLQKSLKTALVLGVTDKCYVDGIRRPKSQEKKVECFTLAEQRKIEQYAMQAKKSKLFGIVLCLYTGLRIGELLALGWTDVDLQKGLLFVNKSCHYGKDRAGMYSRIVETPKTAQSERVIPLPKVLLPHLKTLKKQGGDYIVSNNGKPISTRSYQNSFSLILEKLHIPHKGFHSLRHTFATRALESGMDVKTLSEILGHKNPTVTLHRYCHSLIEHKMAMMNKLGKFCGLQMLNSQNGGTMSALN